MGRALERVRRPRWLLLHALTYLVVVTVAVAVWWSESQQGVAVGFWPLWVIILLGLPLFGHGAFVLATAPSPAKTSSNSPRPGATPAGRALATVSFTDIVGSTERASQVGDRRWGELLDEHDRLARELVERFNGRLIKSSVDGILATFEGPGRAISCAIAVRDGLRASGVEIRAGLHTGEVEFRDSDIGGIAVHTAARVMAAADAGEVLVSRTVHDLVAALTSRWRTAAATRSRAWQASGDCSRCATTRAGSSPTSGRRAPGGLPPGLRRCAPGRGAPCPRRGTATPRAGRTAG